MTFFTSFYARLNPETDTLGEVVFPRSLLTSRITRLHTNTIQGYCRPRTQGDSCYWHGLVSLPQVPFQIFKIAISNTNQHRLAMRYLLKFLTPPSIYRLATIYSWMEQLAARFPHLVSLKVCRLYFIVSLKVLKLLIHCVLEVFKLYFIVSITVFKIFIHFVLEGQLSLTAITNKAWSKDSVTELMCSSVCVL